MTITPDTKDWTWVLQSTCKECSFDVRSYPREEMARMLRENARQWQVVLAHPLVTRRPRDDTWSALEYACHVRDVFKLYENRLQLMLEEENPLYPNWDQDATAVAERYDQQDPKVVAAELERAADDLADRFDLVKGDDWQRTGRRSDGASFTIESFARYLIHDPVHHLHDVQKGFGALHG